MSYFIRAGDVFYYLDATTSIDVTYPGKLSTHPLHSKETASDHYFTEQPTMNIEGVISDIKSARSNDREKSTQEYLDGLIRAMQRRTPLWVRHRLDKEEEPNWFITSFNPSQNTTNGFGGIRRGPNGDDRVIQSFRVSIQLSRALIAEGATTSVEIPQAFKDVLQEKGRMSSSTQAFDDTAAEQKKELTNWEKSQIYIKAADSGNDPAKSLGLSTRDDTP